MIVAGSLASQAQLPFVLRASLVSGRAVGSSGIVLAGDGIVV